VNLASGETTTQSMADALNAATEIHNSMVTGQYNAYVYWWLVNSVGNGYYSGCWTRLERQRGLATGLRSIRGLCGRGMCARMQRQRR